MSSIMSTSTMPSMMSTSTLPPSGINRLRQTIAEIIADAKSTSIDDQLKALHTLASITRVNPQNRLLVAQTPDAIPTFLTLSKSSAAAAVVQTLSLSILFNLSLNPDLKQSLADLHTIQHLNHIIISPAASPEAVKLAASLVCSLAMLDKNKAKFGVAGTVQALLSTISYATENPVASHHVLSSLAELVQFHGNCTVAVRAGAVPVLMAVVESTDGEDLAGTSLAVLGLLARFEEGLRVMRETEGVVAAMVEVLRGRCMMSKEGAAEILIRLLDESEVCLRDAVQLAELPVVLADVSVRGSVRAREKAALLLRKLTEASPDMFSPGFNIGYNY